MDVALQLARANPWTFILMAPCLEFAMLAHCKINQLISHHDAVVLRALATNADAVL
jgi:hypothetical protein